MYSELRSNAPLLPNPRRVAAGHLNRLKRGPLSVAGRERLRITILKNKPWLKSTGPTTPEGRARAAENGRANQKDVLSVRQARAVLAQVRSLIRVTADITAQVCGGH
jgi:hypothetical protein